MELRGLFNAPFPNPSINVRQELQDTEQRAIKAAEFSMLRGTLGKYQPGTHRSPILARPHRTPGAYISRRHPGTIRKPPHTAPSP